MYNQLQSRLDVVLFEISFPLMCFNDNDQILWDEDPHEYIRKGYDILEDLYSPKSAAVDFVIELVRKRGKDNLQKFLQFIVEVFKRYNEAAAEYKPYRQKDGALLAIGALCEKVKQTEPYKSQLEPMLVQHVFPEFSSPVGHLRAKAAWVAGQYAHITFSDPNNFRRALHSTVTLMRDIELPVRVNSVFALRAFVEACTDLNEIRPILPQLLDEFFKLMNEVEHEDLVSTLETIVDRFGDEMAPYAVVLCQNLATAYWKCMNIAEADEEGDNAGALAAVGCLRAVSAILESVSSLPHLFAQVEPALLPIMRRMLTSDGQEVFEEVLEIVSYMTFYPPTISLEMWSLWPLMMEALADWAIDFFPKGISKTLIPLMKRALAGQHLTLFLHLMKPSHLGSTKMSQLHKLNSFARWKCQEEKLHKLVLQSKINETKDVMKRKANEIDKSKIERSRGEKGGYTSLQSMGSGRNDSGFGSETSISSSGGGGYGSSSGFGLNTEVDSLSSKTKGRPPAASASAPSKGLGMKLGKSQKTNQFLESLKAEGEMIVEDVRPSTGQSRPAASPPSDPVTLTIEEKLNVTLKQDGGIGNFDLQGTLSLQILNQEDGLIQVQVETGGNPGILYKTHPNINKELFSGDNILGLKDPNRPFPAGQAGDGVSLVKWRMQSGDESLVPLSVNCWPSVSGNETYVNLEYEVPQMFQLQNVVISIPLPALREAPKVQQIDGEWRYDPRKSILEWSIILIDNNNRSGSMEFVIPAINTSDLFPISVHFTSTNTFSDLKVLNILPVRGGNPPKFSQKALLSTEKYQIV